MFDYVIGVRCVTATTLTVLWKLTIVRAEMIKNGNIVTLHEMRETWRRVRSSQPRVTLREAQEQAARVMAAARNSPHRLRHCLSGERHTSYSATFPNSLSSAALLTAMAMSMRRGLMSR